MLQFSYSRGAESEADDHALRILRDAEISAKGLAEFFIRIIKKGQLQESGPGNLLSTHPATRDRLAKALRQDGYKLQPALSAKDWRALESICGASDKV